MTQSLTKASLGPVGGLVDEGVTFQFNPKSIKVSHTAALRELGVKESTSSDAGMKPSDPSTMVSSLTAQQELEKQGKTSLTLDNLIFDGAMSVQTNCGRLLNWTYPITRTVVQTGTLKEQTNIYLQPLTFCWGNFNLGEEARDSAAGGVYRDADERRGRFGRADTGRCRPAFALRVDYCW